MKNVLLVFGGKSYEHDISVVTASQIIKRTKLEDIRLVPFYISRDNKFYIYDSIDFEISDFSIKNFKPNKKKFKEVAFVSNEQNIIFSKTRFGLKEYLKTETAIFACHGGDGENGKLLSLFEFANISCSTGSFDSLSVCMNKYLFKQVMKGFKIPVVSGFKISKVEFENNTESYQKKISHLKFPVVLKPNNGGSSIGIFIANSIEELQSEIYSVFEFDNEVLIERYIEDCREFNVAVLGNLEKFEVSEVDEPLKKNEILTFSDKYLSNEDSKGEKFGEGLKNSMASSSRKFPAEISEELKIKLQKFSSLIFSNLNLSGVVRIDFLYNEKNDKLYVCEVNSIPGSLAFYFFNNKKLVLNDFVLNLVEIAEKNRDFKLKINEKFLTEILD